MKREKLIRARIKKGISQKVAAGLMGVSRNAWSLWELGKEDPYPLNVGELCKFFGVKDPSELDLEPPQLKAGKEKERSTVYPVAILTPGAHNTIKELLGLALVQNQLPFDLEPWAQLSQATIRPATATPEMLSYFRQLLECAWGLSNTGELYIAEQLLSSFLPKIIQLAPYQQQATFLAAEGMRLRGILAAHQQRMLDKLMICLQAVEYARQAQDSSILIAQLAELAIAFIYAHQPSNAFNTYKEALSYCEQDQLSPLVRSRIYAASAATFAKYGYTKEAHSYIQRAYEIFPTHLEDEPDILSADNGLFMIGYYEGLYHLVTEHPSEADKVFERTLVQFLGKTIPERWRLIILNYQGLAAILSNQQEKYAQCLETGISAAIALRSKKRLDEVLCIFQQYMPKTWSSEPRIKQIAERFRLESEEERKEELEIW